MNLYLFKFFDNVKHFYCGFYRRFGLVGIKAYGFKQMLSVLPMYCCLYQCVGFSAAGNVYRIVGKGGEVAAALPAVDFTQCFHESVVLSVAHRAFHIFLAVDFDFDYGVDKFDFVFAIAVLDNIGHDEWQVFLCDDFFLVAQLGDTLCHFLDFLFAEFQPECFEVFADIGFTGKFPKRILPRPSEPFGR